MEEGTRSVRLANTLQEGSTRWNPTVDLCLKVLGVMWVAASFVSSLVLNDYLALIGQKALPLDLAGAWGSLVIIGGLLAFSLAAMGTLFTSAHPLMVSAHDGGRIAVGTRISFFVSGLSGTAAVAILAAVDPTAPIPVVLACSVLAGLAVGLAAILVARRVARWRAPVALPVHMGLWVVIATLTSTMFVAQLFSIFRLSDEAAPALMLASVTGIAPQLLCFAGSQVRYACLLAILLTWLLMFVAPGGRLITMLALNSLHLGGGVPATAVDSAAATRICNLGVADRPVLYYSATGCTRETARARLGDMMRIGNPTIRGDLVACWRKSVARAREGCVVTSAP